MSKVSQNQDDLASVLRSEGIDVKKHENILNHVKFTNKNGWIIINFPHKYLYELYKNELKNIVERIFKSNISYNINGHIKFKDIYQNNNQLKNIEYTFDNYISGNNNKIIMTICKQISQSKKIKYNPIVIYGESSSGKTHVVNAIINDARNKKKFIKDLFEINQFINKDNISEIYNNIIENEIAVIENIHEIKKDEVLNILMEKLIDHFYENKKQIIFTYKGNKLTYSNFSESLHVRLNSGLTLNIKNPDLNVRIKFIKRFCQHNKIKLSSDNVFTIATNCDNIRSIKGILLKLDTIRENSGSITPKKLNKLFEEKGNNPCPDFKDILELVSAKTGHSAQDLLTMSRGKNISQARQICMYLCKHKLNWSYPKIGNRFGGRDHSTVIYSVNKVEQLKSVSKDINNMLSYMFQEIDKIPKKDL